MKKTQKEPYKVKMRSNGVWFVEWYQPVVVNGIAILGADNKPQLRRMRKSTETTNEATARRWAEYIYKGEWQGANAATPLANVTVAQLLDRCLTTQWHPSNVRSQATYHSNVRILKKLCGNEEIQSFDLNRFEQLLEELRNSGRKDSTAMRLIDTLKAALNYARKVQYPDKKPWFSGPVFTPKLRIENKQDVIITPQQEAHIHRAIDTLERKTNNPKWRIYKYLLIWLLDTAQRLGAVRHAQIGWISTIQAQDGGMRTVLNIPAEYMKDKKPHSVVLTARCVESLEYLTATAIDGKFFPFVGSSSPWLMWDQIRKQLLSEGIDLSQVKQHTFRHTAVTRMLRQGLTIPTVAKISKHSHKVMLDRYAHLDTSDTLAAIAVVDALNAQNAALSKPAFGSI